MNWLATAKTLPAGHSVKIKCCGSDASLNVTNGTKGYMGYCFRCQESFFEAHGEHSIATLQRRREELAFRHDRTVVLPKDFSLDIPPERAVWLWQASISSDIARHYGFGYSKFLDRVVLPVYNAGTLTGFTARSLHDRPKYIEKSLNPSGFVFRSDDSLILPSAKSLVASRPKTMLFTEDILSAVRTGRVLQTTALCGTSANIATVGKIVRENNIDVAVIWLDGDKAGRAGAAELDRLLQLLGVVTRVIRTELDPKRYSNREIMELIQ